MTPSYRLTVVGLLLAALALTGCTRGSDISGGAALAEEAGCVACHGLNGRGTAPTFPNINGQHASYMFDQLKRYRSGERVNVIMNEQVKLLSNAELDLLARYYAAQ
ncbi:MAG: c-type cytochrome [Gammaproteobacteria bacterium]|nr:c-type cytochrome [Gammaproteobacteria bacterium]